MTMRTFPGLRAALALAVASAVFGQPKTTDTTTDSPSAPTSQPAAPTESSTSNQKDTSVFSLTPTAATTEELPAPGRLGKVVVTSDLDVARAQIAPSLGATSYTQT